MKKIIYIELSNYVDFPLGGHLSFAKHLTTAMKGDIDLVGISTDNSLSIGVWSRKEISGFVYNFFNIKNIDKNYKKPLIPARFTDYLRIKRYIKTILESKQYDFILIQTPEVLFSIPKRFRHKVVLVLPGCRNPLLISRYKCAKFLASLYDKLFFHFAKDVFLSLAAADNDDISHYISRSRGTVNPSRVIQFPTRYDANIFHLSSRQSAKKLLSIDENEITVVTTGRLNWFKGWKYMIDAFELFSQMHENARFYFIGNGEDKEKILSYIAERNLSKKVVLAGAHPLRTVAQYLNAADLFIMGSYFEGWSTSLVEAVACANPCVVTQFSSAHDLIHENKNGFVQDKRDVVEFASLMEKALFLDFDVIKNYAENAYSMSVQTMRSQLNKYLNFE